MLTKNDLVQIGKVVDDKITTRIAPVKRDVLQIRKGVKTIVNFFDNEYLELRKRVERIEEHLQLPPVT